MTISPKPVIAQVFPGLKFTMACLGKQVEEKQQLFSFLKFEP